MFGVTEVNRLEDLLSYRPAWDALWRQTRRATFFQSLDWLEVYWRHFACDQTMRVLMVSAGREPIGILPLVVRKDQTGLGPIRVLTYPLSDWGTFYGPVGPHPTATLLAGMQHVRRTPRDWDLLDLRWVDEAGADHGRTPQAMTLAGLAPQRGTWARASLIELDGGWEAYWKGRTKKWRHNVNRCQRRLEELGRVTYLRYRPLGAAHGDVDPRWDLYDACVLLAERSWQGASTDGNTLSHPEVRRYLRDTHAAAARTGCLDLNLLMLDDRPAAFAYNYCCQGAVSGLRIGYEPELSGFGPGGVVQRMILEDGVRRGDVLYDLGPGSLEYKQNWQTAVVTSYRYAYYPWSAPRMQLLRLRRWVRRCLQPDYLAYAGSA